MRTSPEQAGSAPGCPDARPAGDVPAVTVVRTARGWSVRAPGTTAEVADVLEGLALADLLAEGLGSAPEPDRTARRAARGPAAVDLGPDADPRDARLAALERTVAQLEHALAARVSIERAIGVLAERHRTPPRAAFDLLRGEARGTGRPVHELARAVLAPLEELSALPPVTLPPVPRASGERRARTRPSPVVAGDGRS